MNLCEEHGFEYISTSTTKSAGMLPMYWWHKGHKFVAGGKGLEIERFTFQKIQERVSNRTFLFRLPVAAVDWKRIFLFLIFFTGNQASRNLLSTWFVFMRLLRTPVDICFCFLWFYVQEALVECGSVSPFHLFIVQQMFVLNYVFPYVSLLWLFLW